MDTSTQTDIPIPQPHVEPAPTSIHPTIPPVQFQLKKTNQLLVWGLFFTFLFLFSMFSFVLYEKITAKPVDRTTPTPTFASPSPTPIPHRALSSVAATSAFTTLDEQLSTYTKELSGFTIVDPHIAPPVLVLPLDFKK